jgi:hypothetical protein
MEYINSIHRVTKDDLSSFFAEIENLRKSGEVSATEDAELRSFYTKFKGDVKKYPSVSLFPVAFDSDVSEYLHIATCIRLALRRN